MTNPTPTPPASSTSRREMAQTRYYHPTNRGLEGKIGEKLAWLAEQDQNSPIKRYR